MADPLKALGDLRRIQSGADAVSVRSGNEAAEKVDKAIALLREQTEVVKGSVSASEGRLQGALEGLGDAISSAVNTLYEAVNVSSDVYLSNIPEIDLKPVLDAVNSIPKTDTTPIIQAVENVGKAIDSIPAVDLTDLMLGQRLLSSYVQEMNFPETDLSALEERLGAIEAELEELKKPKNVVFEIERVNSSPLSPMKRVVAKQSP